MSALFILALNDGVFRAKMIKPQIEVTTKSGKTLILFPVPMKTFPSSNPLEWLKFQKRHIEGTSLYDSELTKIQNFMRLHLTEALTDGNKVCTLAGGMLAECDPLLGQVRK